LTAPTHSTFGILLVAVVGALIGLALSPVLLAFAVLGALLPDIDTRDSTIGLTFSPVSIWVERRFGHRGITHSLVGLAIAGILFAPIVLYRFDCWLVFLIGYFSHILIDAVNKTGVPLFYPSRIRAVMPGSEKYRIRVGTTPEYVLLAALVIITVGVMQVNKVGAMQALHHLIRSPSDAVSDYRLWSNKYRVYAKVKGINSVTQEEIDARFEVIGTLDQQTLVVKAKDGAVYSVGPKKENNIISGKVICEKGERIRVQVKTLHLKNQPLSDILKHVNPKGETHIFGKLRTNEKKIEIPQNLTSVDTIVYNPSQKRIELGFATARDIKKSNLGDAVASGIVVLRCIYSKK